MKLYRLCFLLAVLTAPLLTCGCGGSNMSGVADAPTEPAPELTPDQRKAEAEAAKSARGE